jgi:hypothetical protein
MVSKTHESDNSLNVFRYKVINIELNKHPVFDFTLIFNVLTYTQSCNFTLFFIEV